MVLGNQSLRKFETTTHKIELYFKSWKPEDLPSQKNGSFVPADIVVGRSVASSHYRSGLRVSQSKPRQLNKTVLPKSFKVRYGHDRLVEIRDELVKLKRDEFPNAEGRPLEVGVQAQTSNHRKRRGSRVVVVNVAGKGGADPSGTNQEDERKRTAEDVSKKPPDVETGIETLSREAGGGEPVYRSTGVRHEGGVILIQAWVRNVGTCRPDAKGDAQAGSPRKRPSTEAEHRGGVAHSRGRSLVTQVERRSPTIRPRARANQRWEEPVSEAKPYAIP